MLVVGVGGPHHTMNIYTSGLVGPLGDLGLGVMTTSCGCGDDAADVLRDAGGSCCVCTAVCTLYPLVRTVHAVLCAEHCNALLLITPSLQFLDSLILGFPNSEILQFSNSGILGFRDLGIWGFRSIG